MVLLKKLKWEIDSIYFILFQQYLQDPSTVINVLSKTIKIPTGEQYRGMVVKAIHMIMMGFLYKYIIAHLINVYAIMPLLMHLHGFTHKWLYMYAYSFYLFFDFAGYSLFAIAVSYLYGINTPPNFKQPFKARNIKDFGIDGICHYHSVLETVFI